LGLLALALALGAGAPPARAQAVEGRPKLCARDQAPTVLVGRFRDFNADQRVSSLKDHALSAGVVSVLLTRPSIAVSRLEEGPSTALLEDALTGGSRGADSRSRQMAQVLSDNDCQFLFGGQITSRGDSSVLTPYLLDADSGAVIRPFPAISFEKTEILTRIGERLAQSLESYLAVRGASAKPQTAAAKPRMEFLCPSSGPASLSPAMEAASNRMRDTLRQRVELFGLERGPTLAPDGKCAADAGALQRRGTYVVAAGGRLQETREGIGIRPEVTLVLPNDAERVLIPLPAIDATQQTIAGSRFAESALKFVDAITDDEWRVPSLAGVSYVGVDGIVQFVAQKLKEERQELAVLSAYRAAAKEPGSVANYALGKALLGKGRPDMALPYLTQVEGLAGLMAPQYRAQYFADLGGAYAAVSRSREASEALTKAQAAYAELKQPEEARRTARAIADVHFQARDFRRAREAILMAPDARTDIDSLSYLAKLEVAEERYDAAEQWLSQIPPRNVLDANTRLSLAQINHSLGLRFFETQSYAKAADRLRASLDLDNNPRVRYALATALSRDQKRGAAITEYEALALGPAADKLPSSILDGSWLNLLELYLLEERRDLDGRVIDASRALAGFPQSRVLAEYIGFVGRLVHDTFSDPKEDPGYKDLKRAVERGGINVGWNNREIEAFAARKLAGRPDALALFSSLTAEVFAAKTNLPPNSAAKR
jgi:hypothetical protein